VNAAAQPAPVPPLVAVLRQLERLIESMTDEQYRARPLGALSGPVGGHVRHCLDHIAALLAGVERGEADYDTRQRGTDVETCRAAALAAIRRQSSGLLDLPAGIEGRPLWLSVLVSPGSPAVAVETTVGRELAFLLSHTIHHNALIGILAAALGVAVPGHFGHAPSTLAHLEATACVR
jgi:hypothetical protein